VFVVTYPKCGTTWMQQIVHGLRTRGSMDFEEISQVVPWTIVAHDCGIDIDAEQVANPRCFKSHETYEKVPKGGKYIYVTRNPRDVLVSFYHFLLSWVQVPTSDVTMEEFCDRLFAGRGSNSGRVWDHMLGWWQNKGGDHPSSDVLWVTYEDLKDDLETWIRRVAAFIGVELDDELLEIVKRQSSFEFMKEHGSKFDEHWVFNHLKGRMGIDSDVTQWVGKVRAGGNSKEELPPAIEERLQEMWSTIFQRQTGIASYEELRAKIRAMHE
jgi:hypothetical protein